LLGCLASELTTRLIASLPIYRVTGTSFVTGDWHVVVLITEEEMWQLHNENPKAKGIPKFYCITRNGGVQFFPSIDVARCSLMAKEGAV
jgi:hypothetical protein